MEKVLLSVLISILIGNIAMIIILVTKCIILDVGASFNDLNA
ncbi:hypothetical protein [Methanobacterium oryzae]